MLHHRFAAAGISLAALLAVSPATAAAPDETAHELQQLKDQLATLRQAYEARLQSLERRITELQQQAGAGAAATSAAAPPAALQAPSPAAGGSAASAFNPAISLILNGRYAHLSRDPSTYRLQGFMPSGDEAGPGERGFGLGESELNLAANIDPTFSGRMTVALGADDSVEIEEALFEKQGLFPGGSLRAGRFLSSIGYLNSQHAHTWDFIDAPLAYQAFFGGPLKTDGVQLRWLAPTERYLEFGAELGSGRSFPGSDTGRNGVGSAALSAHLGDDIGASASWRAGLSLVGHRATDRRYEDEDAAGNAVTNAFTGRSRTWVLDGVYKWAPGGNATRRNLMIQGEYFQRRERGSLGFDVDGAAPSGDYRSRQSGWYLQTVYQFMPMWRVGARHDRLSSGTPRIGLVEDGTLTAADFPLLRRARPSRDTLMVDYSLSEFSRLRLQFAADRSNAGATDRQFFLQYIMSLGAHGAHTF